MSGKYNSNYDGEVVIANYYFVFNKVLYEQEELEVDGGGGVGGIYCQFPESARIRIIGIFYQKTS